MRSRAATLAPAFTGLSTRDGRGRAAIVGAHSADEVVRADPFAVIDLELASLWAD
jgi:hypothetical protein